MKDIIKNIPFKPYHQEESGVIYCADCLDVMKNIQNCSVDLVVTSPPYDDLRDYEGYVFDFENTAIQLYRIIKDGGVVVWVVGDSTKDGSESGTSFRQALFFKECGFKLHDTMIYQKTGMSMPDSVRYYQNFEYMFILSKNKPKTINLLKDRKNRWAGESNFGRNVSRQKDGSLKEKKDKNVVIQNYGVRFNIWQYKTGFGYSTKDQIAFNHPAIFPDKLAGDHIQSWSNKHDTVLDIFNGSGTTIKMAKSLSRKFIGIDLEKKYCDISVKRLSQNYLF